MISYLNALKFGISFSNFFLELKAKRYFLLVLTKRALYDRVYNALKNMFIINTIMKSLELK